MGTSVEAYFNSRMYQFHHQNIEKLREQYKELCGAQDKWIELYGDDDELILSTKGEQIEFKGAELGGDHTYKFMFTVEISSKVLTERFIQGKEDTKGGFCQVRFIPKEQSNEESTVFIVQRFNTETGIDVKNELDIGFKIEYNSGEFMDLTITQVTQVPDGEN